MKNVRQNLVKNGVHIGTQRKLAMMKKYIFKVRDDGLAVLNIQSTINRLKTAAKFVLNYPAQDVLVIASREQAQKPAQTFAEVIGATHFMGRFMPGTMTNPDLEYFMEPKLLIACDPYADRQAISEAVLIGIPVICLASTNNTTENVDLVIPANNKGQRSLAAVFWAFANYVAFEKGEIKQDEEIETPLEAFINPDQQD